MLIRRMLIQICSVFFYFIFYFKSVGYGFKSSVNSVCTIKKLSHLSSLLYSTVQLSQKKIKKNIFFAKIFSHRNSTTPSPIHYPSYAHAQCRNIEKSTPAPKLSCLCRSISILLVYAFTTTGIASGYYLPIW